MGSDSLFKSVNGMQAKGFAFHGKISPTGWEPDGDLSYEQWEQDGQIFQRIDGSLNWIIGDWLNYGERKYGETYAQAIEWTGNKLQHLANIKWICGAIKTSSREEVLSWTHHGYIAHLPDDEQREWLHAAKINEWSSKELLQALESANAKRKPLPQPQWTKEKETESQEYQHSTHDANMDIRNGADLAEQDDGVDADDEPVYMNDYMYESSSVPEVETNGTKPHVAHNSGNNEWYTPEEYITAAKGVLGSIDLDPASSVVANEIVGASDYYTADDDGLSQEWIGKVWMNPPYESSLIVEFARKLCDHCLSGDVPEAIVLVNNATETGWFQSLAGIASSICFPRSRVRFWKPNGEKGAPLQGQAILYIGHNQSGFNQSFGKFGFIAKLK